MDPLTASIASSVDWKWLLIEFGYPTVVSFFLAIAIVALVVHGVRKDKKCEKKLQENEKKLETLREYTESSLQGMRQMQNQERESSMRLMNTLAHDVTNVLSQLLSEMKAKREQEEKASAEIIEHIDRAIANRNGNDSKN